MNPNELRSNSHQFHIQFLDSADRIRPNHALKVFMSQDDLYLQALDDTNPIAIQGKDASHHQKLFDLVKLKPPMLFWLAAAPTQIGALLLGLELKAGFNATELEFLVTEKTVEDVQRKIKNSNPQAAFYWLEKEYLISGKAILIEVYGNSTADAGFKVLGSTSQLEVQVIQTANGHQYKTTKVLFTPRRPGENTQLLQASSIRFVDSSAATLIRQNFVFSQDLRSPDAYLTIWDDYNRYEAASSVAKAQSIGFRDYYRREQLEDGSWKFYIQNDPTAFAQEIQDENGFVVIGISAPQEITSSELPENPDFPDESHFFYGRIQDFGLNSLIIQEERIDETRGVTMPPDRGAIWLSVRGNEKVFKRRQAALKNVRAGKNPMPQLVYLLEGQEVIKADYRRRQPLSPAVNKLFSGGRPNAKQLDALDVALNTPDIALIQGPPGTGKTRVIAALQTRLAETIQSGQPLSGLTLLSSFQHEAVEHVAQATRVYGLPAIKVGKQGRDQSDYSLSLENWRAAKQEVIQDKLSGTPETNLHRRRKELNSDLQLYQINPGDLEKAQALLRKIKADLAGELNTDLYTELSDILEHLQRGHTTELDEDLEAKRRLIRGLPTSQVSFEDDGPKKAYQLKRSLKNDTLEPNDQALLEQAASWLEDEPTDFVTQLKDLRERLLERFTRDELPRAAQTPIGDILALLQKIQRFLADKHRASSSGTTAILEDYLEALRDPDLVKEAAADFSVVLAATCQQAVGYEMRELNEDKQIVFDTVVIDEAARANPLDLLIPMSIAKRRIILVGDQRQLPHLLEPEVEHSLMREGTLQEHQQKALRESLFGRLFARMKELEKKDGIKRTVTLDTQYRMHPELAKFVSQQFYAPYKEEFQSVRPAEEFTHRVPGLEGKFAAWHDVPIGEGAEKSGQSKSRPSEAKKVAALTKEILTQCPELSVGVITFYSEQVRSLWSEFGKLGLSERQTEENQRSAWQIAEQYRFTEAEAGEQQERLRLGTVDAFQGKEFDVVILSLTRSNTMSVETENPNSQRQKWGHLSLENRLNVAMSRQKRLLIVVGDREMVLHSAAQEAIPALVAFERLCRGLYE